MGSLSGHRWPGASVFVLGRRVASSAHGAFCSRDGLGGLRLRLVVFAVALVLVLGLSLAGSAPAFQRVASALAANGDQDNDGIPDASDNCSTIANADQSVNPCSADGDWGAPLLLAHTETDHNMLQDPLRTTPGSNDPLDLGGGSTGSISFGPAISPDGFHVAWCTYFNGYYSLVIAATGVPIAQQHYAVFPNATCPSAGVPVWLDNYRVASVADGISHWYFPTYNWATGEQGSLMTLAQDPYYGYTTIDGVVVRNGYDLTYSRALNTIAFVSSGYCPATGASLPPGVYEFTVGVGLASLHRVDGPNCTTQTNIGADDPVYVEDHSAFTGGAPDPTLFYRRAVSCSGFSCYLGYAVWNIYKSSDGLSAGLPITSFTETVNCSCVTYVPQNLKASPYGDHVAYTRLEGGTTPTKLYVDATQLTTVKDGSIALAWSPDGTGVAYPATPSSYIHVIDWANAPGGFGDYDTGEGVSNDSAIDWRYRGTAATPLEQTYGSSSLGANGSASLNEPVNTATGAFWTREVDVQMPGVGQDFSVVRSYNSLDTSSSDFGPGWAWSYGAYLAVQPSQDVIAHGSDGQQLTYTHQADGTFKGAAGATSTLSLTGGVYTLKLQGAESYLFDSAGKLTALKDRNGNTVSFGYTSGKLTGITDTGGRAVTVARNAAGLIGSIVLPDARHVDYGYDTSGRLQTVTDLRGKVWTYAYDGTSTRLASILDPNGHWEVRNTYDPASHRVTQQLDPLGNATAYAWDAATQTATATMPAGVWRDVYRGNTLLKRIDPNGGRTSFGYDANLNRTSSTDARGNKTTMTYDTLGNLLTRTAPAPLSYQETWTYNGNNDVLSYKDGRGNTTSFEYDSNGNLIKKTQPGSPANLITSYGRAASGNGELVSMTTPRGNVAGCGCAAQHTWTYGYDSQGNRTSVSDPSSPANTTTYGFDGTGRMTSITDARGNVTGCNCASTYTTQLTYNEADKVLTRTDPLTHTTTYTYDPVGKLKTVKNAKLKTWTYDYNNANELITITAPDLSTKQFDYDSRGNETLAQDELGNKTTYTYDVANRLATTVDPAGNVSGCNCASQYTTTNGYDAAGNLITVTDQLGNTTGYGYDGLNRRTSVVSPRGNVSGCGCASQYTTAYTYDGNNNLTLIVDATGRTSGYGYDPLNRKTTTTDGRNKTWTSSYDPDGNLLTQQDQLGDLTSYGYDNADRLASKVEPRGNVSGCGCANQYTWNYGYDPANDLTSTTDPLTHQTQYHYDAAGRKDRVTDPNQHATVYSYDELDRLSDVTAPDTGVTHYGYDDVGNLTSRRDANNHTTTYNYDLAHQLSSLSSQRGQLWTYFYDANGRLTKRVDANGNATPADPNDGTSLYGYYNDDRLHTVSYSDATPTVSYSYDPDGNRLTMADGQTNNESYSYDNADRLTGVSRGTSGFAYQYDAAGNVSQRTYPDGTTISYGYDDAERMNTVSSAGQTTSYTYNPNDSLATTTLPSGNGYLETRQYDQAGALTELKNARAGTALSQYDLAYDPAGNPSQLTAQNNAASGSERYSYDPNDRLTEDCFQATACTGANDPYLRYGYDQVGNRLTETRPKKSTVNTYNNVDQLTQSALTDTTNAVNPYSTTVQTDGAQPYWRLGEPSGSTSFASTVGSYTGTWFGSPTLGTPGAIAGDTNTAVTLNSNGQYGTVANAAGLNKANNFSLELWLKRTRSGALQAVAGKPLSTTTKNENYAIWLTAGNFPQFEVGAGTGNKSAVITSSLAITDTTGWHHIVGTFASGVLKIYLDSVLRGTNSNAGFTTVTTNTSAFNVSLNSASNYFGGSLDEIAVYGTALTATQIADHNAKGSTSPSGTVTTTNYSYDSDGHQTGQGSSTFAYNVADQLTQTTIAGATSGLGYDGNGNRLTATSAGTTTNYLWDSNNPLPQLVLEQGTSNSLIRRYINGNDPISTTTPAGTFYYQHDQTSSTADLTSSTGATEWAYTYDPYGTPKTTSKVDPNAPANPVQFDSQYADGNNLYNLRAREYDTTTGRLLQTDPKAADLSDPYVANYVYANDQPALYDDPSGEDINFGAAWRATKSSAGFAYKIATAPTEIQIGLGQFAINTVRGTADFIVNYPTYFTQNRNLVAERGLSVYWDLAVGLYHGCADQLLAGNFQGIGRNCAKLAATLYGGGETGIAIASGLSATLSRLGPTTARILAEETGSISLGSGAAEDVSSIDPALVRFSQDSIRGTFRNGGSVEDLAAGLRSGAIKPSDVAPIRVVERDGELFTLDNRRLEAFQRAGVPIRYRYATPEEAANAAFKFTTRNGGQSVRVRGG